MRLLLRLALLPSLAAAAATCTRRIWARAPNPTCDVSETPDLDFDFTADGACHPHQESGMSEPDYYTGTLVADQNLHITFYSDSNCYDAGSPVDEDFEDPINTCLKNGNIGWKTYNCTSR